MVPTLRDVVGVPVPGLPGTRGTRPSPGTSTPFGRLMEQVLRHEQEVAKTPPKAALSIHVPRTVAARRPEPLRAPRTISPVTIPRGVVPKRETAPTVATTRFKPGRQVIAAAIRKAAATAGVDSALSVAVARAESNLNPAARSSDGRSKGTFQVLPTTAAEMRRKFAAGTVVRPTGHDDVAVGVGYLRYLHDLFARGGILTAKLDAVAVPDGEERRQFAVAAFNAGEGRVAQAQKRAAAVGLDPTSFDDIRLFLPTSTRAYVDRVAGYTEEETVEIA